MVENRFSEKLTELNFTKLNSNAEGIYLFYKIIEEEAYVISVMKITMGEEFTLEQYEHILSQLKNNFFARGFLQVNLLSLLFTEEPQKARQLCIEEDSHWIIDLNSDNIIIYENQSSDFLGLKDILEKILEEERYEKQQSEEHRQYEEFGQIMPDYRMQWLSPVNTTIVVINVIIFIIINILFNSTGFFGGTEKVIKKGALAYSYILKNHEYYRMLTSMFLHADLDHIFNNMLVLMFVGANLEKAAGKFRYLFVYFGAGILAGFSSIGYNMWKGDKGYGIGASGAIFGVVGAMLYILILNRGRLQNISSRQMLIFTFLSLYGGFVNVGIDNAAHIGGFIGGFILAAVVYRRPKEAQVIKDSLG